MALGKSLTIADKMAEAPGPTTGFDYLRVGLSVAILWWHSISLSTGDAALDARLWSGPIRFLPAALVPMFFALSGFLVAGSLERNPVHRFLTLRVIRIVPALAVEVALSAVVIGVAFTSLDPIRYYASPEFLAYLLNVFGFVHMTLPGVFAHNPLPGFMNGQLWTIPFEFECYAVLVALSLCGVVARRRWFLIAAVLAVAAFTLAALTFAPVAAATHLPGRALVIAFLFGVLLHAFRDVAPCNDRVGGLAAAAAVLCLQVPALAFVAAAPVAYATVWLGLKRPPAIRFGDLSYGIFLFHFPVLQVLVALTGDRLPWWGLAALATPLAGLIALASWTLVEKPVLGRKRRFLELADRIELATRALRGRRAAVPQASGPSS